MNVGMRCGRVAVLLVIAAGLGACGAETKVTRVDAGVVTDVLLELAAGADPAVDRTGPVRAALGPDVGPTLRRVAAVRPDDIPVTVTGKVRKVALRERHLSESAS